MKFLKSANKYLVKLERGEKIIETLTQLAKNEDIKLGLITAIGAVDEITLGYYELSTKSYHWQEFKGDLEVTSLNGNITLLANEPFLHIHMTISDENLLSHGGHLKEGKVAVTLEIVVEVLEGQLEREMDDAIGLNLFKFAD